MAQTLQKVSTNGAGKQLNFPKSNLLRHLHYSCRPLLSIRMALRYLIMFSCNTNQIYVKTVISAQLQLGGTHDESAYLRQVNFYKIVI